MPGNIGLALLRLVLFPDLGLFLGRGGGDRAQLLLVRHAAERHHVEHRRMQMRQQLQAADGAHRQRQRVADRLLVPALGLEPLDRAPDVHTRHRGADQVLGDRAHRIGGLVSIAHHHVDCRQSGLDRGLHPAVANDDHQPVVLRDDGGRLDDADRLDRGDQLLVHCRRHWRAARIVRVELESPGINAAEFGHGWLLWVRVSSSLFFGKTHPARRIPIRRGKGARSARPKAGPLRRRTAMRQPSCSLASAHSLLARPALAYSLLRVGFTAAVVEAKWADGQDRTHESAATPANLIADRPALFPGLFAERAERANCPREWPGGQLADNAPRAEAIGPAAIILPLIPFPVCARNINLRRRW